MNENDSIIVQRDPLPIQVLNKLMDWIMDGKLTMGEKLNTEELARQLGVSRMPIREALRRWDLQSRFLMLGCVWYL